MPNIISLVGKVCSGKTTIGCMLSEEYKYPFHSMGEFYRRNLEECFKDYTQVDSLIEEHIRNLMSCDNDLIIEGRTSGIVLNRFKSEFSTIIGVSILLEVSLEKQIERYLQREISANISSAKSAILHRDGFDKQRLLAKYGIDIFDKNNYDWSVDTSYLNMSEVCSQTLQAVGRRLKCRI